MTMRRLMMAGSAICFALGPAFASGFGFYEQGAKASGQGSAWVARADDASANWYDPAALVRLDRGEAQVGINYLDIGRNTSFNSSAFGSFDAVSNAVTPAQLYFAQPWGRYAAWGIGINSPFGLITEWKDPPVTLSSRRADLRTYLVNPNVAFTLGSKWSYGVGADYLSAEVNEFSHDLLAPPSTADLSGEGDAWGYNAAVLFRTSGFSAAAQYRSRMAPSIEGHVTFTGAASALNSTAHADIDLPAQSMIGFAWTGGDVDVEADGYYTEWSRFEKLDIETGNPVTSTTLTENWSNTWSYRLGLAFRYDEEGRNEVRVGFVRDTSPIPVEHLRPSIPDADRSELSVGYGYLARRWGIDGYAMRIWFDDVTAVSATGPPFSDGVLPGTYKSKILLAGLSVKYRF